MPVTRLLRAAKSTLLLSLISSKSFTANATRLIQNTTLAGNGTARHTYDNGVLPITAPWPLADMIYVSVVGAVMLAALLEWFLWIAAFLYCLFKTFMKADHWTVRVLSLILMIL